jgi:hypothetical protein
MKAFMFGFNIFSIAGVKYAVSKFTKTRAVAGAIYRDLKAANLDQFLEVQKDTRKQDEYIVCVIVPFVEGETHPAMEILKKHGKSNAAENQQNLIKELEAA